MVVLPTTINSVHFACSLPCTQSVLSQHCLCRGDTPTDADAWPLLTCGHLTFATNLINVYHGELGGLRLRHIQ